MGVTPDGEVVMGDPLVRRYREWMEDRALSPRTVECRLVVLSLLARHVRALRSLPPEVEVPFATISTDELRDWQPTLRVKPVAGGRLRTPEGRHTYLKFAKEFYRFCQFEGLLAEDPAARLVLPKIPRREADPIEPDDLDLAIKSVRHPRLLAWLLLACLAGLRVAEIAAVERADVHDRTDPPRLLVHGKGAKERTVPLEPCRLLPALRPFLAHPGPIFLRVDGTGPVTARIVGQTVNNYLASLGIEAKAHSLRKWYGTWLYELSGHDALLVQRLLGHEKLETIVVYVRWNQAAAAPVVSELAKLIAL